jgi:hypothetical protein
VESGGGSNNKDLGGGRTPPDEQEMRIGRARVARGIEPDDEPGLLGGIGATQALIGGSGPSGGSIGQPNRLPNQASGGGDVADSMDLPNRFRPWADTAQGGPGPIRCHFLRSVGPDGRLAEALKTAVPTHRCAAFGDPLPLSLRQQELVCLQRVHVSCPRYVRGTLLANENQSAAAVQDEQSGGIPILTIAGVGMVILALGVLLAAGLGLPPFGGGAPAATQPVVAVASASGSASASASRTPAVTISPTESAPSSPSARPSASPTAAPTPTPTPTPTPAPTSSWPPGATALTMNLVTPCPNQANCYIYVVRGPGAGPSGNGSSVADNVAGIARFFGVDVQAIYELNPGSNSGITPGQKLKIPPPTR